MVKLFIFPGFALSERVKPDVRAGIYRLREDRLGLGFGTE
jgi:hypothetical protein